MLLLIYFYIKLFLLASLVTVAWSMGIILLVVSFGIGVITPIAVYDYLGKKGYSLWKRILLSWLSLIPSWGVVIIVGKGVFYIHEASLNLTFI